VWVCLVALVACGDDDGPIDVDASTTDVDAGVDEGDVDAGVDERDEDAGPLEDVDAGPRPDGAVESMRCRNGEVEGDEECDDGNTDDDDECHNDCTLSCGDGEVQPVETCDTAIASGEDGACPESCDDGDACTAEVRVGEACTAACETAPITACMDGDGCCPSECNANVDDDCEPMCGNMVVEDGERCEPGVDCPESCDDGNSCTNDRLRNPGTCNARCRFPAITACDLEPDGCCPDACNSGNDGDCSADCGNMFLDPGETCDEGSATPCPTDCDDEVACTADELTGTPGACNVQCSNTPIDECNASSDGCCPSGCNETTDPDCEPRCGNMVIETGEDCDDGDMDPDDGCDMCMDAARPPTAFRMTDLDLRDPHAFASIFGCRDITDGSFFGQDFLNPIIQTAIETDEDGDGDFDINYVIVFRPLDQGAASGMLSFVDADCIADDPTTCDMPVEIASEDYMNSAPGGMDCLDTEYMGSSVVRGYSPSISTPTAPCFASVPANITVTLSGIDVPLAEAQIGGRYVGAPATTITNGLVRGFLTETAAEGTFLPDDLPFIGGASLAAVLRGGDGNCASGSDMDTHPTLGDGWWLFLNYTAEAVPYSE